MESPTREQRESVPPETLGAAARASNGARGFARDLFSRELLRYLGPGFIVTIGFIDPGNWATNIAGGSQFGYTLLWVVSFSTLMLIFLQHLSAKLGIITGRSLAVNIRTRLPRPVAWTAGVTIVLACVATDLAEYLGAALGFNLLFGIPLWLGAPITVGLVFLAILGQQYHRLERMIVVFLAIIALCYVVGALSGAPRLARGGAGMGDAVGQRGQHPRRARHAGRHRHAAQHLRALQRHPVARLEHRTPRSTAA